jgi:RHS repeat-associated protein
LYKNTNPQPLQAVSEIDIPGTPSQKYTFGYDPNYGRINKITFPGGGYVRYLWGVDTSSAATYQSWQLQPPNGGTEYCYFIYDMPAITDRYVSYDGSTEILHQHFSYSTTWGPNSLTASASTWTGKTTTVTSTDSLTGQVTVTTYNYSNLLIVNLGGTRGYPDGGSPIGPEVPVEQSVVYQDGSGHTLKTINKTWRDQFLMLGEQTILDNGQGMTTLRCYSFPYVQLTDVYEYGFQSEGAKPTDPYCANLVPNTTLSTGLPSSAIGPLRRHTATVYHTFSSGFLINEPDSITVTDGSGNQLKQTTFTYTETVQNPPVATAEGLVSPPAMRGNVASISRWRNLPSSTTLTTNYAWFNNGNLQSKTDPRGYTTSYSYTDNFASGTGSAPGQTNAYITGVTYPNTGVAHTESFSWGYSDGQPRSLTDENSKVTTYAYSDPLARLTQIQYPVGLTSYSYNDTQYTPSITTSKLLNPSGQYLTVVSIMDGLGHATKSQLTSDPDCSAGDTTVTTYDGFGRILTKTNPYCTTNDPTYGVTTYAYDALGRTTKVTNPDNTTVQTTYTGRATEVQDEGNGSGTLITRISQIDGLGRLASMCEVASGPFVVPAGNSTSSLIGQNGTPASCGLDISGTGFLTTYGYDWLDDLLQVNQGTMAARTFTYDSLSRLLSAYNPESGTLTYSYDADSNVQTKTAPAPNQTGGSTVVTTNAYDALNRLLTKSYNDGKTPTATFVYDSVSNFSSLENTIGRLVESSAGNGIATYSGYDPMGRVNAQYQYTPLGGNNAYSLPYTYDYLGNILTAGDGYFHTYTFSYNPAARLTGLISSLTGGGFPGTLLSGAVHNAAGQVTTDTLGTSEVETYTYTKRNQLQAETAKLSATQTYAYSLTFAPDGDVTASTDSVNGKWNYSYDQFNRLVCSNLATNGTCASPTGGTPTYNYIYDRFGNRWQQNGPQLMHATFTGNNPANPANNNRMDIQGGSYMYDAAGNMLTDGANFYTYDAENRIIEVQQTNSGGKILATYQYDADGQRVHRTGVTSDTCDATGNRDYVYDLAGHWVLEVGNAGTQCKSEIYAAGRHYVTDVDGQTHFDHSDWLGTVRLRNTYSNPNSFETCTSLPFGDALTCTPSDSSTIHFTGKDRDAESGLDNFGARYNSSIIGRFMSPDWSAAPMGVPYASFSEPQSLNLYSYATNNPVTSADLNGHCPAGPGCALEITEIITRAAIDPIGFAKSLLVGSAKGESAQIRFNFGMAPSQDDVPSSDVERAGNQMLQATGAAIAVILPLATGGEDGGAFIGPKEGSSGGPGAGKDFSPATKQSAVDENAAANGGVARCVYCGTKVTSEPGPDKVNIDHVDPKANAGNNTKENAQVSCQYCNQSKGTAAAPKNPRASCQSPSSGCPQNANMGMSPP